MGRNKFSQRELEEIGKLLRQKNAVNRGKQKLIRHQLRVDYEFNISDFNEPGKAFGEDELRDAVKRGAIQVLDDATIAAMSNGNISSSELAVTDQQALFNGSCLAILRSGLTPSQVTLTAECEGLKSAKIKLTTK